MRRACVGLGLLIGLLVGCAGDRPARTSAWLDRFRQFNGPSGPDAVYVEFAVLEKIAGDGYVNRDVWSSIDEQVLDGRAALEDNGFRVGLVGSLPSGVQDLLASKAVINQRHRRLLAGNPTVIVLTEPADRCEFRVHNQGEARPTEVSLTDGQCGLSITPTLTADGKVRLQFAPEVQFSDKKHWLPPGAVPSNWPLSGSKPVERYASLGWELTVGANEYVVVGTAAERPETLGNRFFVVTANGKSMQRLLLIRAGRVSPAPTDPLPEAAAPGRGVPPVALQASYSNARGKRP